MNRKGDRDQMNKEDDILVGDRAPISGTPAFDAEEYLPYVAEFDLTEEQASELLATLWEIMKAFVDLGFGVDSIHEFLPAFGRFVQGRLHDVQETLGRASRLAEDATPVAGSRNAEDRTQRRSASRPHRRDGLAVSEESQQGDENEPCKADEIVPARTVMPDREIPDPVHGLAVEQRRQEEGRRHRARIGEALNGRHKDRLARLALLF